MSSQDPPPANVRDGGAAPHVLGESTVAAYLAELGLLPPGQLDIHELSGGVSSTVLAVSGRTSGVVVKRALHRLKVKRLWHASRQRTLTEARAIQFAGTVTPGRVPAVVSVDTRLLTLVIEKAHPAALNWRETLMEGSVDPSVGAQLGSTLAKWHRASWLPWERASEFEVGEAFEQLRLRPFHGEVAARHPDLADRIQAHADQLRKARICLVHGDFSPKNVLVAPGLLWVVDFEVAHIGHPIFDVAFLGSHLALTAIAVPSASPAIKETWLEFHRAYQAHAPNVSDAATLGGHIGCLILARCDGLSPEPGLRGTSLVRARAAGRALLSRQYNEASALWREVEHALD